MATRREKTVYVGTEPHHAARPMRVVMDDDGCRWLCDADVDEHKDLKEQGCWRCGELAFTRNAGGEMTRIGAGGHLTAMSMKGNRSIIMTTEQLIGHDVFQLLRPDQLRTISDAAEEVSFGSGEIVFRRGDAASFFFIVLDGQVALRLPTRDGVSLLIDEVTRGTIFGSCICFEIDSYTLTAQCTEDSRLLKVSAATLKKLLDDDPVLGYALQTLVSRVYFKRYVDTAQKLQTMLRAMPIQAI